MPLQPSLLPTLASFVSPQAKVIFVSSYVWNTGSTFHLSTTRYPDQADQSCILHIPGIDGIIRNRESRNDLFHQHIAFTYLLQPTTIIPPVQRTSTKFLPSLDQVGTKRGQQDRHQQQLLWLHWHVKSDRFDVQLPSLICDPTIVKDSKRTPAMVSLSDMQGLQKELCFQIM